MRSNRVEFALSTETQEATLFIAKMRTLISTINLSYPILSYDCPSPVSLRTIGTQSRSNIKLCKGDYS